MDRFNRSGTLELHLIGIPDLELEIVHPAITRGQVQGWMMIVENHIQLIINCKHVHPFRQ